MGIIEGRRLIVIHHDAEVAKKYVDGYLNGTFHPEEARYFLEFASNYLDHIIKLSMTDSTKSSDKIVS